MTEQTSLAPAEAVSAQSLIPGDAAAVAACAGRIRVFADSGLRPIAAGLIQAEGLSHTWTGQGGDATRQRLSALSTFWTQQADLLDQLADAVSLYAEAIRLAQARAARVIRLQAYAQAAWPYPAAWAAHAQAQTLLSFARWSLAQSADQLAEVFDTVSQALPGPDVNSDGDLWDWLAENGPTIARLMAELALIVAGAFLMALGTGLDATGVGAVAGVPLQAAGAMTAGAAIGTLSAWEFSKDAHLLYSRRHSRESQPTDPPAGDRPFKKPVSGTGKEKADDVPSWVKHHPEGKPYVTENGKDFATRMLDTRYGRGRWSMEEHDRLFSMLRKYADRAFR